MEEVGSDLTDNKLEEIALRLCKERVKIQPSIVGSDRVITDKGVLAILVNKQGDAGAI